MAHGRPLRCINCQAANWADARCPGTWCETTHRLGAAQATRDHPERTTEHAGCRGSPSHELIADLKDRLSDWKPCAGSAKAKGITRKRLCALAVTPRKRSRHQLSASARTRGSCVMGRPGRE